MISKSGLPMSLQLGDLVSRRFVLILDDGPTSRCSEIIKALAPERVIVRSARKLGPSHHLLLPAAVLDRLAPASGGTAGKALGIELLAPTPAFDASTWADDVPDQCIVLKDGELLGFFDADAEVPDVQRGLLRDGSEPRSMPRRLTVEMEREVELGEIASLSLSLGEPPEAHRAAGQLPTALPPGSQVDFYLRTVSGFEPAGPAAARVVVNQASPTAPIEFLLRAVAPGPARIEVLVFHGGYLLDRVVLTPEVHGGTPRAGSRVRYERDLNPEDASSPDLTLFIEERRDHGEPALRIRLWSADAPVPMEEFGPIALRGAPTAFFDGFFQDIRGLGGQDRQTRDVAVERLKRKGAALFENLLPKALQERLWSLRASIRSLRIESEEPWIPWELCRLVGREGDRIVESGFFCEEFVMARWIFDVRRKPTLRLRRLGIIAPVGSDLAGVQVEQRDLLGIARQDLAIESIPCRFLAVLSALGQGIYDGLHFAGHAAYRSDPNRSHILLEANEALTPEDLSGEVANLGRTWPLVFLNACQAGRGGFSLTDLGGWAPVLLRAGAAAFLGPLWEVTDDSARIFAREFYEKLFSGLPIGEAVRHARLKVRDELPGNPAWLTYTLFADPLARLVGRPPDIRA
jgi:hypothetical protein